MTLFVKLTGSALSHDIKKAKNKQTKRPSLEASGEEKRAHYMRHVFIPRQVQQKKTWDHVTGQNHSASRKTHPLNNVACPHQACIPETVQCFCFTSSF